jgi:transcriptional regulator with XRE-family HTH domain
LFNIVFDYFLSCGKIGNMTGVADILEQGRQRRGWSQQELAFRAGVSVSTISRTEQGRGLPNINSLRRLAAVIGCEPDALVRLAKEPGKAAAPRWVDDVGTAQEAAVSLAKMPGLTTGDRLGSAMAPVSAMLAAMVRVPHFGGVSAVRTELREEDVGGERGVESSVVPDIGVDFTVSVDGQCMAPRYEDGERVGCSVRRWEKEGFVWGKDYWIRFKNGETTLKRVQRDPRNQSRFVCEPLNPKARPFRRAMSSVEKAARVLVILPG